MLSISLLEKANSGQGVGETEKAMLSIQRKKIVLKMQKM